MFASPPIAASLTYILIDVALATVALAIGFFSALTYFRHSARSGGGSSADGDGASTEDLAALTQRTDMATQQIRDLTCNVVSDVSDHNAAVGGFSAQLASAAKTGNSEIATIAIETMLTANHKLQVRLHEAEQKIQAQSLELRTQQNEARTDSLTKLANRRAFDIAMQQSIDGFCDHRRPFSMLLFDVDHFKKFNDTHGHQAGDEVLRAVGRTLTKTVKASDLPCRYGGEEFALIMPNTNMEHARIAAERVRKAIEAMEVHCDAKMLKVTASVGLAEIGAGEDTTKLIRRADDAVYAAKNAGRNCGYWHDGVECVPIKAPPAIKVAAASPKALAAKQEPSSAKVLGNIGLDLPDRTVFTDELRRRISESQRFGVPLSLLHLLVRDYDRLEATYGEAVGQLLLDSVATFVKSTLRDMDLIGKYSTSEFVVMLPGSTENEAKQVGRRVRTAIANCSIPLGGTAVKLNLHLGVAHVQSDDDAPLLMARARSLMEAAAALEMQVGS